MSRFGWRHQLDHLVWNTSVRTLLWLLTPLLGEYKNRLMGWATLFRQQNMIARMRAAAAPGDFSLAGALIPELRKELNALQQELRQVNSLGLSPLHIIEGGALLFQYALTYSNDWRDRFDRDWSDYDDLYRRAFDMARDRVGARCYDVFLPASALALFYERPQDAFVPMVNALASGGPGEYAKMAKAIAAEPPRLPDAGRFLGTANDVKRRSWRWQVKLKRFDPILTDLQNRKGDLDEIELLTDPLAATRIQSFPLSIVTQDQPFSGTGNMADAYAGLLIANYVLGTIKFPRAERELMDDTVKFLTASPSPIHTRNDSDQTTGKPH